MGLGLCLGSLPVHAATPTTEVETDGYVRVQMVVAHPLEKVQAYLAKGEATMRLGSDVIDVSSRSAGPCDEMDVQTRGFTRPLTYTVLRCPFPNGWTAHLVKSDDFIAHDTQWLAHADEQGTTVTMRVRVRPRMPVPQFIIRKVVGSALAQTLVSLNAQLNAQDL